MSRESSYASLPRPGSYSSMPRNQSYGSGLGQGRSGPPEAVFLEWQPSERVQALKPEQIADMKARLSISIEVPEGQPSPAAPIESFLDMNLHANIIADIAHHKYETPTPIQCQGIPVALSGRDILGCAETGSGKTASFAIPMIHHVLQQRTLRPGDGPIGLVLAPTRELAQQIEKEVKAFARSSGRQARSCIVVGGAAMQEQKHDLRGGVEIVVATPGRFIDHLQQGSTNLDRVSFIVLDEADRMLDMGFEPQIKEVMSRLPQRHQTLLFSATMPKEIEGLAQAYLNFPCTIKVGAVSTPTANVAQSIEACPDAQKPQLLVDLLSEELAAETSGGAPMPLTVVFVERKTRCDEVAQLLGEAGISALPLHGGLSQGEREAAIRDFSSHVVRVLVATDVASRGLDIKGIGHVVNMDLPKQFEDYVHRIGRTGRAGTRGRATSFYTERDSFLVTQIKTALAEMAKGNKFAFASGKQARQEERQLAAQFKTNMKLGVQGSVPAGGTSIKPDDKYAFMQKVQATGTAGAADDAWDD